VALDVIAGFAVIAALYGCYRLSSWESKLITDWLDGDRSTPPPSSAFFPENIARQWYAEHGEK
jgi:hypothetical protein